MRNKIECMISAILIVLSVCFIAWAVGLVIPRYLLTVFLSLCAIYLVYRGINPKKRYYFVSYVHAKGFGALSLCIQGYFIRKDTEYYIDQQFFEGNGLITILYYREISKDEYDAQRKEDNK